MLEALPAAQRLAAAAHSRGTSILPLRLEEVCYEAGGKRLIELTRQVTPRTRRRLEDALAATENGPAPAGR